MPKAQKKCLRQDRGIEGDFNLGDKCRRKEKILVWWLIIEHAYYQDKKY